MIIVLKPTATEEQLRNFTEKLKSDYNVRVNKWDGVQSTVLGLIVGAMALLVSAIRKSWYAKYMSTFEAAAECVLEKACERVRARANKPGAAVSRLAAETSAEGSVTAPADGAVAASAQIPGQMEPSAGGSSTFAQREAFPLEGAQR